MRSSRDVLKICFKYLFFHLEKVTFVSFVFLMESYDPFCHILSIELQCTLKLNRNLFLHFLDILALTNTAIR